MGRLGRDRLSRMRRNAKPERNHAMVVARLNGHTYATIAKDFGINTQNVEAHIKRHQRIHDCPEIRQLLRPGLNGLTVQGRAPKQPRGPTVPI